MRDIIAVKGSQTLYLQSFGTFGDYSLHDNFRFRRYVTGWITRLIETPNTAFAQVYCVDAKCPRSEAHFHLICLG